MNISKFKRAVATKDIKSLSQAVDELRLQGVDYQGSYRIALAADPSLTLGEWEDLMLDCDELKD